jgi:hypothetical protein
MGCVLHLMYRGIVVWASTLCTGLVMRARVRHDICISSHSPIHFILNPDFLIQSPRKFNHTPEFLPYNPELRPSPWGLCYPHSNRGSRTSIHLIAM